MRGVRRGHTRGQVGGEAVDAVLRQPCLRKKLSQLDIPGETGTNSMPCWTFFLGPG